MYTAAIVFLEVYCSPLSLHGKRRISHSSQVVLHHLSRGDFFFSSLGWNVEQWKLVSYFYYCPCLSLERISLTSCLCGTLKHIKKFPILWQGSTKDEFLFLMVSFKILKLFSTIAEIHLEAPMWHSRHRSKIQNYYITRK